MKTARGLFNTEATAMLREVLYMLAGESGGVFATAGEDADLCGGVDICGGLPGLSPSERQQLRPLLALGSDVARLGRFVEQSQPESLYLSAVRRAVGERLAAHRQLLHALEDEACRRSIWHPAPAQRQRSLHGTGGPTAAPPRFQPPPDAGRRPKRPDHCHGLVGRTTRSVRPRT